MSSPRLQAHMAHGGDSEHDVVKTDHMVSEASHACKGVYNVFYVFLMEGFLSIFLTVSFALQARMTDSRFCEVDRPKKTRIPPDRNA